MNITNFPKPYVSAFGEACFEIGNVQASAGMDVEIRTPNRTEPLGVKRIYGEGTARVNVAPYARSLFAVAPLCGKTGPVVDAGRTAVCYVSSSGYSSAAAHLVCGTEDAPRDTILSSAPATVKIASGQTDEISVVTLGRVKPLVVFGHGGETYVDSSMKEIASSGMITTVVDADAVGAMFRALTGLDADVMTGFVVRLRLTASGGQETILERRYETGAAGGGRRLAWVNRYGAVDYHTFPTVNETCTEGERTAIETPRGYRTVATSEVKSEELVSEPCDAATAEWLGEVFSSPDVWRIDGTDCERVEVSSGAVKTSPLRPTVVTARIAPGKKTISRKL